MTQSAQTPVDMLESVLVDDVDTTEVVPGIIRRRLPDGAVWARVYDMAPGARWPVVDHHQADEHIYVVRGELLEGGDRYPAGSYLHYRPGSHHQPGTETGVRILVLGPITNND
ncbi:MAG TPA: cupin domain-containing protein [Mycobacteriales bacterium]